MVDLNHFNMADFQIIEAPKHDAAQKARCTFYRVKSGSYAPMHTAHRIADMPK